MANETVITIVGNLTADPEMRFIPSGDGVAKFTVASTPRTFDKNTNKWVDGESLFLTCAVWRQLAENVVASLTKGARVVVTGRLRQHSWEDKETGQKRSMFELDVEEIGPSLRFATATVKKATRSGPSAGQTPPNDPWATAAPAPAGAAGGTTFADEPPF